MFYLRASIENPISFASAGLFIADTPWTHMRRVIDSFEIVIGVKGTVYIQQGEEKYIVKEGDVLLLMPGYVHQGYAISGKGTSFFWMHFYCNGEFDILEDKSAEEDILLANNNPYLNSLNSKILIPTFFTPANIERLHILSRQLLHVYESRYYTGQGMNYLQTSLLIELTEQVIAQGTKMANTHPAKDHLPKILEWIRIHSEKEISLQHIAHEFNYTKEYLARYFKKNMGMSMQEYIHNLKISKAKELLCQSDRNIKEIANGLGFQDEKYFMKLFKRHEKITPREYRRAYNMTHLNNQ